MLAITPRPEGGICTKLVACFSLRVLPCFAYALLRPAKCPGNVWKNPRDVLEIQNPKMISVFEPLFHCWNLLRLTSRAEVWVDNPFCSSAHTCTQSDPSRYTLVRENTSRSVAAGPIHSSPLSPLKTMYSYIQITYGMSQHSFATFSMLCYVLLWCCYVLLCSPVAPL